MGTFVVRQVRPGDGAGCARAWQDAGRYYAALVPEVIQEPDPEGLAGWFEDAIREGRDPDALWLVAEDDGEVAGMLEAALARADPDARRQLQRDLSSTRLVVNALAVAEDYRRRGAGTALMRAAEEWGWRKGAVVAVTNTNLGSPLSVPFYEDRMGYLRQALIFRKALGGG